jgi:choline dehydrogenase-like flavoprotein
VKDIYDVVVVGSGASGGTIAAHLARAGLSVLVLEGGPKIDTRVDFNTHGLPFEFPRRQIPLMRPGAAGFDSARTIGVGGKTLRWNAVSLRFSEQDFKAASHDGAGVDWPIGYTELAPYYSQIEREIGVCGNRDGLPNLPDGEFMPPPPLKCSEQILQRGAESLDIKLIHTRKATLTRPMNARPACHYCGNCMAGCDVAAKYNSADVHLYPAERETGNLEILPDSIVYELAVADDGPQVKEVRFIHRQSGERQSARGRIVVVGCACELSIALLLMSKSERFPRGLANNSGQVGRHFIPHIGCYVEGFLKDLIGTSAVDDEGFLDHAYIPSFMHDKSRDYVRSFGIQVGLHNRRQAPWAKSIKGIGAAYKRAVRDRYPAYMTLVGVMEMTPNEETYVGLNPSPMARDQYGLALPQVNWKLSEQDQKRWQDMQKWCVTILEKSGAEVSPPIYPPLVGHPLGGCRMGTDPQRSVVDSNCRTHEVSNLYVVDGSVFPSASEKNPTLTIMAVAARAADHITKTLEVLKGGIPS